MTNTFTVGQTLVGLLTVTDGATTCVVSSTIPAVVINGNGGNDSITVGLLSGVLQTALTINGGDGDDTLNGQGSTDVLAGNEGNDVRKDATSVINESFPFPPDEWT